MLLRKDMNKSQSMEAAFVDRHYSHVIFKLLIYNTIYCDPHYCLLVKRPKEL